MSGLQKQTQSLQELNPEKESWNIVARVVRLWFVKDYTKGKSPFFMEIVLQDKEGVLIHATAYTLFSTIKAPGFDTDYLVNVIGMFTGTERELEKGGKKTKMNVILIESDGYRLECSLFGQYVDMLNAFIASGEDQYVVIALSYCKVKIFQDKVSIQNCMNCTRIIFNCDGEDAMKLKKMMWDSTESPSQPLTQLGQSSKESTFVVKATIKHVLDHDDWWYTACICNKVVFKLRLRVIDATDSTTFVVFDRDASAMLKKSCYDILNLQDKVKYPM
ncbi:uncharacterized protein LOC114174397 [Vigna unguiculata]|uniref:uncharacterized protein LOC114174397 n=1 Tax=Vigna unguiculata TaxID=3917 RepID=UPI001016084A|nr:uncharacterized protein LOC114174397 [Vigna unguiculata]